MTLASLRSQIELEQPLPSFRGFTLTTTDANATTVLTVSSLMEEANRITFVVEFGDLYINFGGTATSDGTSMLVPAGTGYTTGWSRSYVVAAADEGAAGGWAARTRRYTRGRGSHTFVVQLESLQYCLESLFFLSQTPAHCLTEVGPPPCLNWLPCSNC